MGRAGVESAQAEGGGIRGHLLQPLAAEIAVFNLTDQSADGPHIAVQRYGGLRLDAAQQGLAGHEVVEGDGGGVGRQTPGAADEPVGGHELRRFVSAGAVEAGSIEPGEIARRHQPVAAVEP